MRRQLQQAFGMIWFDRPGSSFEFSKCLQKSTTKSHAIDIHVNQLCIFDSWLWVNQNFQFFNMFSFRIPKKSTTFFPDKPRISTKVPHELPPCCSPWSPKPVNTHQKLFFDMFSKSKRVPWILLLNVDKRRFASMVECFLVMTISLFSALILGRGWNKFILDMT